MASRRRVRRIRGTRWTLLGIFAVSIYSVCLFPPPITDDLRLMQLHRAALTLSWRQVVASQYVLPAAGSAHAHSYNNLKILVEHLFHYTIEETPGLMDITGNAGQTTPYQRRTQLDTGLSVDQKFQVLAHEVGHMLSPPHFTPAQAEVFAESVAYLICHRAGFDSYDRSVNYLVRYKQGLDILDTHRSDIRWAVAVVSR